MISKEIDKRFTTLIKFQNEISKTSIRIDDIIMNISKVFATLRDIAKKDQEYDLAELFNKRKQDILYADLDILFVEDTEDTITEFIEIIDQLVFKLY